MLVEHTWCWLGDVKLVLASRVLLSVFVTHGGRHWIGSGIANRRRRSCVGVPETTRRARTLKHESQTAKVALESQVTSGMRWPLFDLLVSKVAREVSLRSIADVLGLMQNGTSGVFEQHPRGCLTRCADCPTSSTRRRSVLE